MILGIIKFGRGDKIINMTEQYDAIIKKIDNKESFNLLILKGQNEMKGTFNYYEDVYSLKYEEIQIDTTNNSFKKLIKKFDFPIDDTTTRVFMVIEKGVITGVVVGEFKEKELKETLISSNVISQEYKDVDVMMDNDFSIYNDDNIYNILYLGGYDIDVYKYRKQLVENKIKSLLLYSESLKQADADSKIREKLNMGDDLENKFPILIKYRNGEILESIPNITVDNLVTECNK